MIYLEYIKTSVHSNLTIKRLKKIQENEQIELFSSVETGDLSFHTFFDLCKTISFLIVRFFGMKYTISHFNEHCAVGLCYTVQEKRKRQLAINLLSNLCR